MNEQLQTALSEIINKALKGVDASVDFLQAEIPDYVYQLLLWYGVKNAFLATIYLLLSLSLLFLCKAIYSKLLRPWFLSEKQNGDAFIPSFTGFIGFVSALFVITPLSVSAINCLLESLQIWIAPKVWLLEYAANMVK